MSNTQQNVMDDKRIVSETTSVVASDAFQDSESQNCEISKCYSEKCAQNEENTQIENVTTIYTQMSDEDDASERTSSVDVENQLSLETDLESSIDCEKKFAYCTPINYILKIIMFKKYLKRERYFQNKNIYEINSWTNLKSIIS